MNKIGPFIFVFALLASTLFSASIEVGSVATWPGKVNQHKYPGADWQTDSDGSSGSNVNILNYFQKFFANTTNVTQDGYIYLYHWKNASNLGDYGGHGNLFRCYSETSPAPQRGSATFTSSPSEAHVNITRGFNSGGAIVAEGTTPYTLNLNYGDYKATYTKEGYSNYVLSFHFNYRSHNYDISLYSNNQTSTLHTATLKADSESVEAREGSSVKLYLSAIDYDNTPATPDEGTTIESKVFFLPKGMSISLGPNGERQQRLPYLDGPYFSYDPASQTYVAKLATEREGKYYVMAAANKGSDIRTAYLTIKAEAANPPKPPEQAAQKISLKAGWNMISAGAKNPVSLSSFISSGTCKAASSLWSYNPQAGQYQKAGSLKAGEGYWLKVESDCASDISGTMQESYPETVLNPGWNQVGSLAKAVEFREIAGTCATSQVLYRYDPANNQYATSTTLEPGFAYWAKVSAKCTLGGNMPPGTPA